MSNVPVLTVLAHDRVYPGAKDSVVMSRKSHEGLAAFARYWPGRVRAVFRPSPAPPGWLDDVVVGPRDRPYELRISDYEEGLLHALVGSSLVLSAMGYGFTHVVDLCDDLEIPCVYITELTLTTERQMVNCEGRGLLQRWRKCAWLMSQERRNVGALRRAAGVQCNGVPTYRAYESVNPRRMLFFDTRLGREMLAKPEDLRSRSPHRLLRLAFSGRLIELKGVRHLPEIASELRRRGVPFVLRICGDGPLRGELESDVKRRGLQNQVVFMGNMDFATELMPLMKSDVDVFVCCHLHGDPSCTYLETMGCGVPIAGYANEALAGLHAQSGAGWMVPPSRPRRLAKTLARLARSREEIASAAERALAFAEEHCFEETFQRRIDHLYEIWLSARRPAMTPLNPSRGRSGRARARVPATQPH
jgi:colanic acid/amylovoran biosynthesis glycosyltransferase